MCILFLSYYHTHRFSTLPGTTDPLAFPPPCQNPHPFGQFRERYSFENDLLAMGDIGIDDTSYRTNIVIPVFKILYKFEPKTIIFLDFNLNKIIVYFFNFKYSL